MNKKAKSILIFAVCAAVIGGLFYYLNLLGPVENVALREDFVRALENEGTTKIKDQITFTWDTLYVLPPYSNLDKVTVQHSRQSYPIEYRDDINSLVFTKEGQIVSFINLPRKAFEKDFKEITAFNKGALDFQIGHGIIRIKEN